MPPNGSLILVEKATKKPFLVKLWLHLGSWKILRLSCWEPVSILNGTVGESSACLGSTMVPAGCLGLNCSARLLG